MENPFKKQEIKQDLKPESKSSPVSEIKPEKELTGSEKHREKIESSIVIKTEMDAYISEIIKGGPQSVDEIQVRDYTPANGKHRLSLPDAIEKKYGKKYAFRWVNKKKDWIDRAINIRRWLIVNRTLFSDMPKFLFTANGTIENGDTILCFMPMAEAERLRREPQELSRQRVKDLPMEQWKTKGEGSPFYKPALGQEERDGEVLTAGIQPDLTPTNE